MQVLSFLKLSQDVPTTASLVTLFVQVKTLDGKSAASSSDMQLAPTAPDSHHEHAAAAHLV